jgi:hypothetical protein
MSYSGTVRCGHCYEKGHNKTSCPELKKKWEENPDSYYGRQWATYQARKKRPKTCSYCGTAGHTRAGCAEMKRHKSQFQFELSLWRRAVLKWAKDTGLGIGALVRAPRSSYRRDGQYMYPGDEDYIPAAGMIMHNTPGVFMTHYQGINETSEWTNSNVAFASFDIMGVKDPGYYGKSMTLNIPCIPGIVPQYAERKNYYGDVNHYDREDYAGDTAYWEVVSPAVKDFNSEWVGAKELKRITKEHFKGSDEQAHSFHCFTDFQRDQLQKYVNGEIELSEMSDPELSSEDS